MEQCVSQPLFLTTCTLHYTCFSLSSSATITAQDSMSPPPSTASDGQIPLPDIRDQLKRKELQQKIAQMEAEEEAKKVKIKRSDKEAFTKVSGCLMLTTKTLGLERM